MVKKCLPSMSLTNDYLVCKNQNAVDIIISIKPKYVEKILNKEKLYEFRKVIFKEKNIRNIFIYASSPIKKIVAICEFERVIEGTPQKIWEICREYAGITEEEFFSYFSNREKAYSIKLKNIKKLHNYFDPYQYLENFRPPQSFMYADIKFILSFKQSSYVLH
ncbi:hypothetical protein [Nitrosophilus labii]|uniref:hypothetical protein n=1 Tax=Nitrosophilus labii TaxID=2706014 RepID=UPI0016569B9A|nr:hypothetical protein [Nitrosophilus labii]